MSQKLLTVDQPMPDFLHLGHTVAFTVGDYEPGNVPDGYDLKNDLLMETESIEKLSRAMAAKMFTNEDFRNFILYTVHVYHVALGQEPD